MNLSDRDVRQTPRVRAFADLVRAQVISRASIGRGVRVGRRVSMRKSETKIFPHCLGANLPLALRDISLRRSNSVAFGAKRTLNGSRCAPTL